MPKSDIFQDQEVPEEVAPQGEDHPEPEHVADPEPVEAVVDSEDTVKVFSEEVRHVSVAGFEDVTVGPEGVEVSRKHAEALDLSVPSVEVAS